MAKYQFDDKEVPLFVFSSKDDVHQYIVTDHAVYQVGYNKITALEIDNKIVQYVNTIASTNKLDDEIPF